MSDLLHRIAVLKKTAIFSAVYTEDLRVVAEHLDEEVCFKGERLFEINDPSDRVYFVEEGKIGISIDNDPEARAYVSVLGPSDCLGEMGMFDDQPRSATAHVLEDSRLLALDKSKLKGLLISYPNLAMGLLRTLSLRLRKANLAGTIQR